MCLGLGVSGFRASGSGFKGSSSFKGFFQGSFRA